MKRNLSYLVAVAAVAFMAASCVEEEPFSKVTPTPGQEVAFSADLGNAVQTKTLYGEDADGDAAKTAIKVKWVDGDLIKVYGTTCANKEAEYKVAASASSTANKDDGQDYADDLAKTGTTGVQWGESGTSDFYAVYPSDGASFTQNQNGSVRINTTISATQNYVFNDETVQKTINVTTTDADGSQTTTSQTIAVWEGTHFSSDATNPSMSSAVMYAYTKDAAATDEAGNPKQVDLHFKPISTVLKFRFMGYTSNLTNPTVHVQSITVTAPDGYAISGNFGLDITGNGGRDVAATATATGNNTNSITLNTILPGGGYLPLSPEQAVDFNVFTVPVSGQSMGGKVTRTESGVTCEYPWKVTITTAQHGTFTYTVIPAVDDINTLAVGSSLDATAYSINPGKIHKVKVPMLTINSEIEWDYTKWMTQIPTPVYLSELSIPGAWYCMDSGYQNSTDIATLYNAGIRAFNIDCRITKKGDTNDGSGFSILGGFNTVYWEEAWSDTNDYPAHAYLACSGTEGNETVTSLNGIAHHGIIDGKYVSSILTDIINVAKTNKQEYVVVVFTFAEKPKTVAITSDIIYGSVRTDYITEQLNAILNTTGIKEYLYTGITKDTTIDDVLKSGKNVIVKINHSNVDFATSTNPSFSMPDGHMASFASMAMDGYIQTGVTDIISGLTTSTSPYYGYYAKMQEYPIYNGKSTTDLTYYFHQAQKTSSDQTRDNTTYSAVPTLGQRMDAIDDIIEKSVDIYDASTHNAWFQLGIGGSLDGDNPAGISDVLNPYLQGVIETKMAEDPSPVGIVLMNHATDTDGNPIQLVKDIVHMNGKFYLKRAGGNITTGSGDDSNSSNTQQSLPASNGAYAYVGEDAF